MHVCLGEAILAQLNALLDRILNFKHVYGRLIASARYNVQSGVEHNVLNDSITRASTKRLESLATICTEDLDYSAALRCRCNQRSIWVDAERSKLSLMSLDQTVHAILGDYNLF